MVCLHKNNKKICSFDGTNLFECKECGFIFSDKYKTDFDPRSLYENFYKNELGGRFGYGVEHLIRAFRFFRAFKIFTLLPTAKSILDIGSGRGFLLYYLKKYYGYRRTVGTQISREALELSRNKLGLEIYDKDLLDLSWEKPQFEVVTIWHVLEHVARPEEYVEKIYRLLTDRGRFIVEVPNFHSWTRGLTGRYWLGLDLKYHLTFFTPESLLDLLKKYNFEIMKVRTFSLEYSTFISAQSIVSWVTNSDHFFFETLQGGRPSLKFILHGLFIIFLAPFCFLINTLLYFSRKGEVILVVARKSSEKL